MDSVYNTELQDYLKFSHACHENCRSCIKLLGTELFPPRLCLHSEAILLLEPYILDKTVYCLCSEDPSFPVQNTGMHGQPFNHPDTFYTTFHSPIFNQKLLHNRDIITSHVSIKQLDIVKRVLNTTEQYILYLSPLRFEDDKYNFETIVVDSCLRDEDRQKRLLKYFLSTLNYFLLKIYLEPVTEYEVQHRIALRDALVNLESSAKSLQVIKSSTYKPYISALIKWTEKALRGQYNDYFQYKTNPPRNPHCLGFNLNNLHSRSLNRIYNGLLSSNNPTKEPFIGEMTFDVFKEILTTENLREYSEKTQGYFEWKGELKFLYRFIDCIKERMADTKGVIAMIDDTKCFRYEEDKPIKLRGGQKLTAQDKIVSSEIDIFFLRLFPEK